MFLKRRVNADDDDDDGIANGVNSSANGANNGASGGTGGEDGWNNEAWEAGNMENKIRPFRLSGEVVEVLDRPCLER